MTPVLTASEMQTADRRAVDSLGIPSIILMENAARGSCDILAALLGGLAGKRIAVLCGKGNNGGDGLALSRHALIHGALVEAVLLGDPDELSDDARLEHSMLAALSPTTIQRWNEYRTSDGRFDAVVDAMLGTGATGPPRGAFAQAVQWANNAEGLKFALDVPTGIDADTGLTAGDFFVADATATMAALKPGLLLNAGASASGDCYIVHIGVPPGIHDGSTLWLNEAALVREFLPVPGHDANKYDRGKVLVVAGSREMTGAGAMTAEAALRGGAGLVVYAMPDVAATGIPQRLPPEIMTRFLPSDNGAFAIDALETLRDALHSYSVVAVGPGISKAAGTAAMTREIVAESPVPVVLDADGIGAFAGSRELLSKRKSALIVTPHHGEMGRLLGIDHREISRVPVDVARRAASEIDAIVVLKGAPTVIAEPGGRAWINGAGNPGMATGGTGDVLTGIVAALVGQGRASGTQNRIGPESAEKLLHLVLAAVFVHSRAGDLAAESIGERSLVATDLIDFLPQAFRSIEAPE